ncbi:hypothetical protein RUM44_004157 [Polyplax serrata]|uniref:Carboxylesterase type B domain-containing protein n=1 Tax=Polyplax serrata TaxID=468196 RepID=A0ABR1B219_POLSC
MDSFDAGRKVCELRLLNFKILPAKLLFDQKKTPQFPKVLAEFLNAEAFQTSRQGCIHGEELPYVFGAPLVGGFSHFPKNYTKSEMLLSEATMIYWSNFARTGNPNEPQEADPGHGGRQERNRFKNIEWIAYEGVHKKYLNIDTKPKVKNHFRAHRLSFWLKLVPDLHRPGGDDVPRTHHLLSEDDSIQDGLVHSGDLSKVRGGIQQQQQQQQKKSEAGTVIEVTGKQGTVTGTININHQFDLNNTENTVFSVRGLQPLENIISNNIAASASASASPPQQEDGFAAYSTALSVTIAIGCSLLIVNVLIFAGVYYQRDKNRLSRHHHHHRMDGGGTRGSETTGSKTIIENGIPNSICGDILLNSEVCKSGEPDVGNFGHIHHHIHHQLPLPEYTDLSGNANLSRGPPTSNHQKLTPCGVPKVRETGRQNFGTLPRSTMQSSIQYSVGTLPRSAQKSQEPVQALRILTPASSLKKKNSILTSSNPNEMDELRV